MENQVNIIQIEDSSGEIFLNCFKVYMQILPKTTKIGNSSILLKEEKIVPDTNLWLRMAKKEEIKISSPNGLFDFRGTLSGLTGGHTVEEGHRLADTILKTRKGCDKNKLGGAVLLVASSFQLIKDEFLEGFKEKWKESDSPASIIIFW